MKRIPEQALDNFVRACHAVAGHGLVRASSGNLSLRLDKERMLVTSSRSWLENLTRDSISVCRIADGSLLEGRKPTVEIGFHAGILRMRPDVNVVMHFQTPCATTLACRRPGRTNYFVIPEIPFYVGHVAEVPYLPPGSKELATAVTEAMRRHDMVVMANHGQVTVAGDIDHAIQNAEFFELACGIILRGGNRIRPLPRQEVKALLASRGSRASGA